jgi:phosphoribosylformylglycinamidine synthase subunit PurS
LSRYRVEIRVTPRAGILDPEGKAIQHALTSLGYDGADSVRVGKLIEVELQADSEGAALETARVMCRRLLANPVTEDYDVRLKEPAPAAGGRA